MKDLEIRGIIVRVTKYKAMIFDEHDNITQKIAEDIAIYLKEEGFIEKDEFPIEIIKPDG
tara:strand:+ start:2412 stop:2591 length:180 start_codon:yes stop_codon:yes gene_type:complete